MAKTLDEYLSKLEQWCDKANSCVDGDAAMKVIDATIAALPKLLRIVRLLQNEPTPIYDVDEIAERIINEECEP